MAAQSLNTQSRAKSLAATMPEIATNIAENISYDNTTLSTIIRFHQIERLPFLEEAVFSLAIQDWRDLEIIIVLQNGTPELEYAVREIIEHQSWHEPPPHKILSVAVPDNVDGRSALLNHGIERASGRYLAFLDDDDFIYHHGYSALIQQLIDGGKAVAVGGCRRAMTRYEAGHWFVQTKEDFFSWGRSQLDLLKENFVPIHSYVIDRSRLGEFDLYFDESFSLLEDYDFLLRLCAAFDLDFAMLDTPVCEYRIRADGSNSLAHVPNAPPAVIAAQQRAQKLIKERKKSLVRHLSNDDLYYLIEGSHVEVPQIQPVQVDESEERRILLLIVYKLYFFFGHYPRLERYLSKGLHAGWRTYKKLFAIDKCSGNGIT